MRLLFVDFDGVLHPAHRPGVEVKLFCWVPALAKMLSGHPDVKIVVHSTWRYDHFDYELQALLGDLGDRFVGSAPRGPRGLAIQSVLQANKELRSYLVLDDEVADFVETGLSVLVVDGSVGVSDPRAQLPLAAWLMSTAPAKEGGL